MKLQKKPKEKPRLSESSPEKREPVEQEVSAGGVVFKRTGQKIWIAMMKDPYGKWTFPKGHVEKGEALEEAAARETLEELGLDEIRLLEELGKIDIWFRDQYQKKGRLIHKDIHYFLFETRQTSRLYPDPEQHVVAAKWVPIGVVLKESSYPDMIPILKRAVSFFREDKR